MVGWLVCDIEMVWLDGLEGVYPCVMLFFSNVSDENSVFTSSHNTLHARALPR